MSSESSALPRRSRNGRVVAQLAAAATVAGLLTTVPLPQVAWAEATVFEHRQPAIGRAGSLTPSQAATTASRGGLDADAAAVLTARDRRRAREVLPGFAMIGLSLSAVPESPVLLRVNDGRTWSDWRELAFVPDHGPDSVEGIGRPGVHSEPLWLGDARGYEMNLPSGTTAAEVHIGRRHRVESQLDISGASATATPSIHPRWMWGARPPTATPVAAADFRFGVVHHSATANNNYGPAEVPAILRAIQAFHMDVNGWNDIGYNFAVDRFGRVWEARAGGIFVPVIGGHAMGFNTGSVGVVVIGDFTTAAPPSAAVEAVAQVLAWKFGIHRVDPNGTVPYTTTGSPRYPAGSTVTLPRIVAHRDVGVTGCPGNQLYSRMSAIRSRVQALFPAEINARPPRPFVGNFDGAAGDEVLVERSGSGFDEKWTWNGARFTRTNLLAVGVYRPAVGDFDGNGSEDVFWHGTGSVGDHVWYGSPGGFVGRSFPLDGSYVPFVGDFDADGRDDVFLYAEGLGQDRVLYGNTDRTFASLALHRTGTYDPHVGDFDADGHDDIFLHDPGQGNHPVLYGTAVRGDFEQETILALGLYRAFVGDFNGDHHSDIFWYDHTPGGDWIFYGTDGRPGFRGSQFQVIGLFAPMTGAFDGDGRDDIFWYSPGNPNHPIWFFTPTGVTGRTVAAWGVFDPRVLDVENNSYADILWYSPAGTTLWRGGPGGRFVGSPA